MKEKSLAALADYCAVTEGYLDFRKQPVTIPEENRRALLDALGFDLEHTDAAGTLAELVRQRQEAVIQPLVVARIGESVKSSVFLPEGITCGDICFSIVLEGGATLQVDHSALRWQAASGQSSAVDGLQEVEVALDVDVPAGRHRLFLSTPGGDGIAAQAHLLVAPRRCFEPPQLSRGERVHGLCLQLYTLRSRRNWGMGDFTDLTNLVKEAAAAGIDLLGLNPLHALFAVWPLHFSPYSPSNRAFLNSLYIDAEAVPEFATCSDAQSLVASPAFRDRVAALRATKLVDYTGVSECKLEVLRLLFEEFWTREWPGDGARAKAYRIFLEEQGEPLLQHATYETLHGHLYRQDNALWGWPVWPEEYRDPAGSAIDTFRREHAKEIHFHQYLQWNAFTQLRHAQSAAVEAGMAIGIYLDLAVGVDTAGSEAWANQDMFAFGASVGAPPDLLARGGQDWGFPPFHPFSLQEDGYALFARNLRASMSCAGAVRVDHCVGLYHLWWIPRTRAGASSGGYVRYDVDAMMATMVLESERNRCLVVGEDLGTVPDAITEHMQRDNLYSYRVLYFEKYRATDDLIPPAEYPRSAVATVTTHDLPTLASWWDVSDLDARTELNLLGTEDVQQELRATRKRDKQALLDLLHELGFVTQRLVAEDIPELTEALNLAVHRYLASSSSLIMMSQIEDWMGMRSPVNIPGTRDEHPNWQRKLRYEIEGFFQRPEVRALCDGIRDGRIG